MSRNTRRDFLKLGAAAAGALLSSLMQVSAQNLRALNPEKPNIILLVFDTFSGRHLALNGYPRAATPNLERFARRATVYHNHTSPANYTTPGTASLLTGLQPWTHRATQFGSTIRKDLARNNIFHLLGDDYRCVTYTQNPWVELLLNQFGEKIEERLPITAFSLADDPLKRTPFARLDGNVFYRAMDEFALSERPMPGLLTATALKELSARARVHNVEKEARNEYPKGIPNIIIHPISYFNEQVFDGMMHIVDSLRAPFLSYFHLWSPHEPYRPRREFIGAFENDGYSPAQKPPHPYFSDQVSQAGLATLQREYDEYIMNVDAEFGRFLDHLEATGLLETSYLFILSDHGQLFERGIHGHSTAVMYENLLRTPLLISAPGQTQRVDVTEPTSNLDLLPTLCALSGRPIPSWAEGRLLPRFGGPADPRPLFAADAKTNSAFTPLKTGSFVIVREGYKLIRYQYRNVANVIELYDLSADAEEMNDLAKVKPETVNELTHELEEALQRANEPFQEK